LYALLLVRFSSSAPNAVVSTIVEVYVVLVFKVHDVVPRRLPREDRVGVSIDVGLVVGLKVEHLVDVLRVWTDQFLAVILGVQLVALLLRDALHVRVDGEQRPRRLVRGGKAWKD
jgi:hypothetical protein